VSFRVRRRLVAAITACDLTRERPTAADGARERARRVELEHVVVAEAIERGEGEVAETAMRLHLLRARSRAIAMRW